MGRLADHMRRGASRAALTLALAGCASPEGIAPVPAPAVVPDPIALIDTNPDPDVVEVSLVASPAAAAYLPGRPAVVWRYLDGEALDAAAPSGAPPYGLPLLEAKQGDLVIVHFRNLLDDGSTVHFHGLRLDAGMDGAHEIVLPKDRFDYTFVARDAGTFWFHPHFHADVQIEQGLQGILHVREAAAPRPDGERILAFDDVKLAADGELAGEWTDMDIAHGREGNVLLVNGAPAHVDPSPGAPGDPVDPPVLRAIAGARERWHLVNTANGRFFLLALPGRTFEVIGWDGGLLGAPYSTETLLVAPGERYDVLVRAPDAPGDAIDLQALPHDRGDGAGGAPVTLLRVEAATGEPGDASPDHAAPIDPLPVDAATPVRPLVLEEDLDTPYGPQFFINGEFWPFNTPFDATQGAIEIWDLRNETDGDHPFHLHGMFFQVLSRSGADGVTVPEDRLGWKDTVLVGRRSNLRFAVRFEAPGPWMFHCQIPEHAERGMMGEVHVAAP